MKAVQADERGPGPAREDASGFVSLEETLQRLGERWALFFALCSILAASLIGILDALSGYEFGFSPFYLIPIVVASYCCGKRPGIATAVSATVAWYLAEAYAGRPYANSLAISWNAGVRLLIFVMISLMLTRLKNNILIEKRQQEKLVELNRMKNQFVGMAAHDLRTPLAVIWMCAESLQRRQADAPDRRQAESIEVILAKSGFMLRMVAALLDLSAIESGSLTLHKSNGDFGEFARRRLEILQALAERKQLSLQFECGALPAVWFDKDRIEQVFDNLIMNAVKFSPPPHSVVTVSVSLEGEIGVTSVCGAGTTFFFTLPVNCLSPEACPDTC